VQELQTPLSEHGSNLILILFRDEFIEACWDFPQYGFNASLNPILWMDVEFARRGGVLRRTKWKGCE
jgi:hypothetical protein